MVKNGGVCRKASGGVHVIQPTKTRHIALFSLILAALQLVGRVLDRQDRLLGLVVSHSFSADGTVDIELKRR